VNALRVLFIVFLSALCFAAGYFTGKRHRYHDYVPPEKPASETSSADDTLAQARPPEPEPAPKVSPEPPPEPTEPADTSPTTRFTEEQMAERAQLTFITLTDKNGRQLKAEILETSEDSVKIQRYRDLKVFDLPVATLSEDDQAYIAYLNRTGGASSSTSGGGKTDEELLMEIFGEM